MHPSSIKEIANKIVSKNPAVDEDLLLSIVDFTFKTAKEEIKSFDNLIVNINGLGKWFMVRKRLLTLKEVVDTYLETGEFGHNHPWKNASREMLLVLQERINKRLFIDYETYDNAKKYKRLFARKLKDAETAIIKFTPSSMADGADRIPIRLYKQE